jgi:murein L,D-transpeptidase YafK
MLVILFLLCVAVQTMTTAAPNPDELLRRLGTRTVTVALDGASDIDSAAAAIGLTRDELVTLARELNIDISWLLDRERAIAADSTAGKLRSPDWMPENLLEFNGPAPWLLLVEKATHRLYVLSWKNGVCEVIDTFEVKTGQNHGDKQREGDRKTPEGVFFLMDKYSRSDIRNMVGASNAFQYGEMAFITDFPNPIDRLNNKNGSGIWLHGTDEPFDATASNDSRGCVVTTNETIADLDKYIVIGKTPLVIVETLTFISAEQWRAERATALAQVEDWRSAWEDERLDDYITHYHASFYESGRSRQAFRAYKQAIFRAHEVRLVELSDIIALRHNGGLVIRFHQDYKASNLESSHGKILYLARNDGHWKIVAETIRR